MNKLPRREFLKGTLIAAGGIAVGSIVLNAIGNEVEKEAIVSAKNLLTDYEYGTFTDSNGVNMIYERIGDIVKVCIDGKEYRGDLNLIKGLPFK